MARPVVGLDPVLLIFNLLKLCVACVGIYLMMCLLVYDVIIDPRMK